MTVLTLSIDQQNLRSYIPTVLVLRMAHRIWKETKHEPGTVGPGNILGCCLVSFHFLWDILCPQAVLLRRLIKHSIHEEKVKC